MKTITNLLQILIQHYLLNQKALETVRTKAFYIEEVEVENYVIFCYNT